MQRHMLGDDNYATRTTTAHALSPSLSVAVIRRLANLAKCGDNCDRLFCAFYDAPNATPRSYTVWQAALNAHFVAWMPSRNMVARIVNASSSPQQFVPPLNTACASYPLHQSCKHLTSRQELQACHTHPPIPRFLILLCSVWDSEMLLSVHVYMYTCQKLTAYSRLLWYLYINIFECE